METTNSEESSLSPRKYPETPSTEETSVAYNSMETTNSEQSSLSPTKTHEDIDEDIENDQNLMLLPIDEAPEIQLNGEELKENCDIIVQEEKDLLEFKEEASEEGKKE